MFAQATIEDFINALHDLYRSDQILSDPGMDRFSLDFKNQNTSSNMTEFELCSDRFVTLFPNYSVDTKGRVEPGENAPRFNF